MADGVNKLDGNFTHGCFLNASVAFDRCWVNGMLAKLRQIKVDGKCLDMFESYLTNRKICTVIDGAKSLVLDVNAGVPQGSRLGPLLWILFSQDIIEDFESDIGVSALCRRHLSLCFWQRSS